MDDGSVARVFNLDAYYGGDDHSYGTYAPRTRDSGVVEPLFRRPERQSNVAPLRTNAQMAVSPPRSPLVKFWDEVARELEALDEGAPTKETINLLCRFSSQIPNDFDRPEVEHDESTGGVTLRWHNPALARVFSVSFVGKDELVTTMMPPLPGEQALWRFNVAEERRISDLLSKQEVIDVAKSNQGAPE